MRIKPDILKEDRVTEKNGTKNIVEILLAMILLIGILYSFRDLCYSNICLVVGIFTGSLIIILSQIFVTSKRFRNALYIIGVGVFVISISAVVQAFLDMVNRWNVLWNHRFGTEFEEFAVGNRAGAGSLILWGLIAVVIAYFLFSQIKRYDLNGPIAMVLIALVFGFVLGQSTMWGSTFLLIWGLIGVFVYCGAPHRKMGVRGAGCIVLFVGILGVLFVATGSYKQVTSIELFKRNVREEFNRIRYGEDTLPKGELWKASELLEGEENRLQIEMSKPQELYLKGFVGTEYEGIQWNTLNAEAYQGDYDGMFVWMKNKQFIPVEQYARYDRITAVQQNIKQETEQVTVDNQGAYRKYLYLPSSVSDWSNRWSKASKDWQVQSTGIFGASGYQFHMVPNVVTADQIQTAQWLSGSTKSNEKDYLEAESVYHSFVEEYYTGIDEELKTKLLDMFFADNRDNMDELELQDVTARIREVLRTETRYVEQPETVPQGEDFLQWFLEDYKKGNAVSYATAAVMAYRAAGYPARYVEGYHLTAQDAETLKQNQQTDVILTTKQAHAWVEIYIPGVGWMPEETVPGMYTETYTNETIQGKPAYQVNSSQDPEGMETQNTNGNRSDSDNQKSKAKQWDFKQIFAGILIGLYIIFIIYGILEMQRILRLNAKKRRKNSFRRRMQEYYVEEMTRILQLAHVKGDFSHPLDMSEQITDIFTEIELSEYERVVAIIQKARFGGKELERYEVHALECFVETLVQNLYRDANLWKKFLLRYVYVM